MNNILAIIPARGGSKGLPGKNIKELNGKPLIAYTIEAAKKSKYIDRVVISTDDKEIADTSKTYGGEIPCLRPDELSKDNSPTIDCVIHMLNYLKEKESYVPEYVALLQCTSPLRDYNHLNEAIEKLIKTKKDAIVSVCEAEVNPYWTNVFEGDDLKYFIEEGRKITRRQDLPKVYRGNGAFYIVKTSVLITERTVEPENLTGYIMSNEASIDIDTIMDFKIAEIMIKESEKNSEEDCSYNWN